MIAVFMGDYRFPWCTAVHLCRELEGMGHQVVKVQEPLGGCKEKDLRKIEAKCRALNASVLFWNRTWGAPKRTTEMWRELEASGTKTASYHLDLYLGLKREEGLRDDPFWTTQYVFTPDGNEESERRFKQLGINHHFMPPAVVSDEIGRGRFRAALASDVIFVGSKTYHPEWRWRQRLIDRLETYYGSRFTLWGGQGKGVMRGQDLNDLYASAKVVVGDSLCLPGNTHYISDRYFETIGRGGFLVGPYVPILDDLGLMDGFDMVMYAPKDWGGVVAQVDHWLKDSELRRRVQNQGMETVRAAHTYRHRLTRALEIMELSE